MFRLALPAIGSVAVLFGLLADPTVQPKMYRDQGGNRMTVKSGGSIVVESGGSLTGRPLKHSQKTAWFNLDNGAGTTVDDVVFQRGTAITITAARIIYVDATTGTVASGNVKIGTTLGGAEIVAATAYENSKAVGTKTELTIVSGAVPADTSVFVRHTGVGATQAGQAFVQIEYTIDP